MDSVQREIGDNGLESPWHRRHSNFRTIPKYAEPREKHRVQVSSQVWHLQSFEAQRQIFGYGRFQGKLINIKIVKKTLSIQL